MPLEVISFGLDLCTLYAVKKNLQSNALANPQWNQRNGVLMVNPKNVVGFFLRKVIHFYTERTK
jgi:hypothetical protein